MQNSSLDDDLIDFVEARAAAGASAVWLADLVFQRHNRSVKYTYDGTPLIASEALAWSEVWPRAMTNAPWLAIFAIGILLNFALFACSLRRNGARKMPHKKLHCYIGSLAFCNVIFALGLFVYTFLIDVYYDVDSFSVLVRLNRESDFAPIWSLAKRIVHVEMVEGFALAQSLILLTIGMELYLSRLDGYVAYARSARVQVAIVILLPYALALGAFDDAILRLAFTRNVVNIIRISALIAAPMLGTVFVCAAAAAMMTTTRDTSRRAAGRSTCLALTLIDAAQLVQLTGLFLALLKHNFMFELVVGRSDADAVLRCVLNQLYEISFVLFLSSPLYCALPFFALARFYRTRVKLYCCGCCRARYCMPREPLDYGSETMRSIIAEQTRARQMRAASSIH